MTFNLRVSRRRLLHYENKATKLFTKSAIEWHIIEEQSCIFFQNDLIYILLNSEISMTFDQYVPRLPLVVTRAGHCVAAALWTDSSRPVNIEVQMCNWLIAVSLIPWSTPALSKAESTAAVIAKKLTHQ